LIDGKLKKLRGKRDGNLSKNADFWPKMLFWVNFEFGIEAWSVRLNLALVLFVSSN